ncbi:MAG TPA: RES family NAD+ phosphorylase [Kofleriaceae bacterium]|nr:RES family NAD+ phosphorylase [Kofleriaceae bacterium]
MVEAQHVVSTRKLVDTLEEQELLEELIDKQKPPAPAEPVFVGLHPLLATPFRYPPLRYGSRFGQRHERGIWYGSVSLPTALAEVAYYRLVFLDGTTANIAPIAELTAFTAGYASESGADLTRTPFDKFGGQISSPTNYAEAQTLGSAMRADGVEVFHYRSARDRGGGTNLGLFTPKAFSSKRPGRELATWVCYASRMRVDFLRKNLVSRREKLIFPRTDFEVGGVLPAPAL